VISFELIEALTGTVALLRLKGSLAKGKKRKKRTKKKMANLFISAFPR
jgi:hypothetical protein